MFFEAPSAVAVKPLLQPMSANLFKRKVRSPSADVYANIPEEKRTRDHTESEYSERQDEALGRPRAMTAEIATKMDLVLSKLDNIESRLNSVCSSVANIEEALTNLEKDVADLKVKTEGNETDVNQLKERVDFNEGDIAEAKRDAAAVKLEAEKLKMNLLYFETYNRRENLKFFGIEENTSNVAEDTGDANMDGSPHMTEDTKQVMYNFLEQELKISNARDRIELQRIHRLGKPNDKGPRPIIARFLRYTDREEVMSQARKYLKGKDFSVFDDIPKELYDLRKKQQDKLKDARKKGHTAFFSKKYPDRLYIDGKFISQDEPFA